MNYKTVIPELKFKNNTTFLTFTECKEPVQNSLSTPITDINKQYSYKSFNTERTFREQLGT